MIFESHEKNPIFDSDLRRHKVDIMMEIQKKSGNKYFFFLIVKNKEKKRF